MLRGVAEGRDYVRIVLHVAQSHGGVGAVRNRLGIFQLIDQELGRLCETRRSSALHLPYRKAP